MPVWQSTNELWRVSQTDHVSPRASLTPVFKTCTSELTCALSMRPAMPKHHEWETRGLGTQPQRVEMDSKDSHTPLLQWVTQFTYYLIQFDLMKTRNKTVTQSLNKEHKAIYTFWMEEKGKGPQEEAKLSPGQASSLEKNSAARILQPGTVKSRRTKGSWKKKGGEKKKLQCVNLYINSWAKESHCHMSDLIPLGWLTLKGKKKFFFLKGKKWRLW